MIWNVSHRASKLAVEIADRHYNRQKPGTPQFVPPGRCVVLRHQSAVWVTSWPFAEYTKHEWAGAWVNTTFRKECGGNASDFIIQAIAATRFVWPDVPEIGIVSFVNPVKVPATIRRGEKVYGYSYLKAGFEHVGFTKGGLWVWQMKPCYMPEAEPANGMQLLLQMG